MCPGIFHHHVQTRVSSQASWLTGDHQLQRVPQGHVIFFLKLIEISEPSRQGLVVRKRVHAGQQADAPGIELIPQNGHPAHEQFRREFVEGKILAAHVNDAEGAVAVVSDVFQQTAFARQPLRISSATQGQLT